MFLVRFFILILVMIGPFFCEAQNSWSAESVPLTYISPVPGSQYNMPGTSIALRHGDRFEPSATKAELLAVYNSNREKIIGKTVLSDDLKTLIFYPENDFELGEKIRVELSQGLLTSTGKTIASTSFEFTITRHVFEIDEEFIQEHFPDSPVELKKNHSESTKAIEKSINNLPDDYPPPSILVNNNPPEGHYFYTPSDDWNWFPEYNPYINIVDRFGVAVYYKKLESSGYDLKIQHNGYLAYYTYSPNWAHQVMDSAFQDIRICKMGNGYGYTDFHDFQYYPNGHYFVMTYDPQIVDMSQVVSGGDPEAIVTGFVMQELDSDDNVIFQWRSWDHFEITETGPEIDLTDASIDYVHGNTIEVESDTSILLSSRNFHEITKIHRNTGAIIWRFGGSQNQFDFVNDTLLINRQHDCRRLPDGRISIFDNGTKRPAPQFSSVPVYTLDVQEMTASLNVRYRHDPDYLGLVMGNAFWTPDSTIVIGWGSVVPGLSEIDLEGNLLFEMEFDAMSYRAYRYPWSTTYFTLDKSEIDFGTIWKENQVTKTVLVMNNQEVPIEITGYHLHSEKFTLDNSFPFQIPAGEEAPLLVTFIPGESGTFTDVLTINSDINTDELVQRIAQQVELIGNATENQDVDDYTVLKMSSFPNPVSTELRLTFEDAQKDLTIRLLNHQGQQVWKNRYLGISSCTIDMSSLSTGLYFIEASNGDNSQKGRIKILKK